MQRILIVILVFAILVAVFALQNSTEVVIKFWFWSIETSIALVVILTFAIGAFLGILFSIPRRRKAKRKDKDKTIPLEVNAPPDPDEDPEFEDLVR
jgi:uncharacterized integral membrane protein